MGKSKDTSLIPAERIEQSYFAYPWAEGYAGRRFGWALRGPGKGSKPGGETQ